MYAGGVSPVYPRTDARISIDPGSLQPLFDNDVLADDQAMGGHFAQLGQNAVHVLVRVHEDEHNRQITSGFDQVRRVDFAAA
jgi:hypothetical protein